MTSGEPADEQQRVRRDKLDRLRAAGVDPFPAEVTRSATAAELHERYAGLDPGTHTGDLTAVAGRVMLNRPTGKLVFATLRDGTGDIQAMLALDRIGAESLEQWKRDVDLGDIVSVQGEVVTTRRGELSVAVDTWAFAAKALRPLPEKYHGLADAEARLRQRHVDLIVNPETRTIVRVRAAVLRSLRETLTARGFVEVETPVLQPLHGGAAARPFVTHFNAFDADVYLRIALELYLKRAVVGGLERVFEIGRIFRNEGADSSHSPEFTMLEAYEAYGDYDTMADLTRALVLSAATAATGGTVVPDRRGGTIDLADAWDSVTLHEAVSAAVGRPVTPDTPRVELVALAERSGVPLQPGWDEGEIVLELFEKLAEHTFIRPTFVRDYPASVRPLARPHRRDPRLAEAWDLVVAGVELAPAYTELVDPVEQRRRLTEQSLRAAGGDPEAMQLDEDFLRALEQGAPPMGGMGLGVDRLVMLLTGVGIRETVLFPPLRPDR